MAPITLSQEDIPRLSVGDDVPAPDADAATRTHHADTKEQHERDDDVSPRAVVAPSSPKKNKKKRDSNTLRKAPQAPRRFKSSYIMFFTSMQDEVKAELKGEAEADGKNVAAATTVTEVSKRSAEKWRNLPPEDRSFWEDKAAKDKQRYMREKATYTGPWQVPYKRAKKDPSAPKRPMSAFLYFSQDRRKKIKAKNPGMKNTEISQVLGQMWRNASDEEKRPHTEIEEVERAKYKIAIAKWNVEKKARDEAEKKAQEEQQRQHMEQMQNMPPPPLPTQQQQGAPPPPGPPQSSVPGGPYGMPLPSHGAPPPQHMQGDPSQQQDPQHHQPPPPQGYDPNMMYQQPPYGMPPPNYYMYPPQPHGYYSPYQPPPGPNGQPVILGPNGTPLGSPPSQQYYPPAPQSMPPGAPPPGQYPPQGQYYPQYGAPPPPQHPQQQDDTPPAHQVYNEEGGGGNPMMAYSPYPDPEQMMGHHHHPMPYQQE
eukprot:CAMPEP_0113589932 /NCGR_PEP_ID=MMETSP0015_2-20120614/36374_1 /TAXON_ID=2838 /ORGANISM="Odontella" /LENGTH=479 /DNA_ID=CAMNT_0000496029 /DNA_START=1168 /DNA_END=2607 /DNA_ORIENTATION=- /assembly_acc=CAM_ASM_000160